MAELKPDTVLTLLEKLDAFRRAENVELFSQSCVADLRGRLGREDEECPQAGMLRKYFRAASEVDAGAISGEHSGGEKIKAAIRRARVAAIAQVKNQADPNLQ